MILNTIDLTRPSAILAAHAGIEALPEVEYDAALTRLDAATLAAVPTDRDELATLLELLAGLAASGHAPNLPAALTRVSSAVRRMA